MTYILTRDNIKTELKENKVTIISICFSYFDMNRNIIKHSKLLSTKNLVSNF